MDMKTQSMRGKRKRITFQIHGDPGSRISVAGSFNDWRPGRKRLIDRGGDGNFRAAMLLPPGKHEYKFVVNGTWVIDPENPEWTANEHGSLNSVLTVE